MRRTRPAAAPSWPGPRETRSRVLIEHPDPAAQAVLAEALQRRGYETLTCGGPRAEGRTEVACPLTAGGACPGVDGADVVVSGLAVTGRVERQVIEGLAADGQPPVIVTASPAQGDQLSGSVSTIPRLSVQPVVEAVEQALSG